MNIIYELNPPKIIHGKNIDLSNLNLEIEKFLSRASVISGITRYIHLTDSVLGIPRLSSLTAAQLLLRKIKNHDIDLSCSIRTRDRNMNSIIQCVADSIILNIKGLLFIQGDKPSYGPLIVNSLSPKPTEIINTLDSLGFRNLIDLNLSIPNKVSNIESLHKKVKVKPHGLVTQSISSIEEIKKLKLLLEGELEKVDSINGEGMIYTKLIPCIMVPSLKNEKAANMIGLDWASYKDNIFEFIDQMDELGISDILLTSPNSFDEGISILDKIAK
ncbi:MAG TPA: hypothetical protein VJR94_11690 [Candidatus Nitrosocosmicus sp.]|nr:hypothetical protein [Candidatus Nitrosocosmicus sp.]